MQLVLTDAQPSRPVAYMRCATHDCLAWSSIYTSMQNKLVSPESSCGFKQKTKACLFVSICLIVHVSSLWKQQLIEWLLVP